MVARAVGEGFDCFLFGLCPARLWRLLSLTLAAAKGEQDIPVHRILTMFLFSAPAALFKIFWSKNHLLSAFAAHLCGMWISLGESYFPPNHNRFTIR